eukprot:scaffold8160_cov134-Skeletonema_marinoi.AAC.4
MIVIDTCVVLFSLGQHKQSSVYCTLITPNKNHSTSPPLYDSPIKINKNNNTLNPTITKCNLQTLFSSLNRIALLVSSSNP